MRGTPRRSAGCRPYWYAYVGPHRYGGSPRTHSPTTAGRAGHAPRLRLRLREWCGQVGFGCSAVGIPIGVALHVDPHAHRLHIRRERSQLATEQAKRARHRTGIKIVPLPLMSVPMLPGDRPTRVWRLRGSDYRRVSSCRRLGCAARRIGHRTYCTDRCVHGWASRHRLRTRLPGSGRSAAADQPGTCRLGLVGHLRGQPVDLRSSPTLATELLFHRVRRCSRSFSGLIVSNSETDNSYPGVGTTSNRMRMRDRASTASCSANCLPMHARAPTPNGL